MGLPEGRPIFFAVGKVNFQKEWYIDFRRKGCIIGVSYINKEQRS